MLDLKSIILILIFLFLLNQIRIYKNNPINENMKTKEKFTNNFLDIPKYIRKNNLKIEEKKNIDKLNIIEREDPNLLYGQEQYIITDEKYNTNLKYQNLDILESTINFDITSKLKFDYEIPYNDKPNDSNIKFKYDFDDTILANKNPNINFDYILNENEIIEKFNYETNNAVVATPIYNVPWTTEPPNDQKMLYDFRFLELNKKKLDKIINPEDISSLIEQQEDKSIKDIYDDLVVDYKKINKSKNIINNDFLNNKIDGSFGEKTLSTIYWSYEDDNNDLGFDPSQSLQVAL